MAYSPNIPVPDFETIMGAPTKYDPAMCQTVLNIMALGQPKVRVAVELQVTRMTLYNWRDKHPEFAQALEMGEQLCEAAWAQLCWDESCGQDGAKISAGGIMAMRNVVKWDTRDKDKTDVVEEAKAILEMGAQMDKKDWINTYGPAAAVKLKQVKGKK